MNSFRDLEIYQLSFELSLKVHHMTLMLPQYEIKEQGNQIRRSLKSISSNIAEGFGRRNYKADFIHYIAYALASCDETSSHLRMFSAIHFKHDPLTELLNDYNKLGRKTNAFCDM